MDREEIIERLADYFGIEPEDGDYDLDGYDWQSGAYLNGREWLSLAVIVDILAD